MTTDINSQLISKRNKNRHSDKRQQFYLSSSNDGEEENTNHQYLMLNLDEYEEEIALIKVLDNGMVYEGEPRCPAPDPIAMLYGIDRYKGYSKTNESDSEKEENEYD